MQSLIVLFTSIHRIIRFNSEIESARVRPRPRHQYVETSHISQSSNFMFSVHRSANSISRAATSNHIKMDIPLQFTPKHVLCGKDKRLTEEEGNKIFKALILENVERYNRETEKSRKMRMTAELLDEFKIRSNGGQFYRYCKDTKDWVLCDDGWVRDKVSHALRFQIKRAVRRPQLRRKLSLPTKCSPKNIEKKRSRSESFDSCPAKIESVPAHDDFLCDQNNTNCSFDDNGESILVDPLVLFDEMISSGEIDQFDTHTAYGEVAESKSIDTGDFYRMGEILTDTEDHFALNDSDDDDYF